MESYKESQNKWKKAYEDSTNKTKETLSNLYNSLEFKKNYGFLVKKEADLIRNICDGDINFIKVFSVYYFLIWNGFFSIDNSFQFGSSNKDFFEFEDGASIINGEGVCLNISAHFRDILKYLSSDYEAYLVGVHLKEEDNWNAKHSKINKKIQNNHQKNENNNIENNLLIDHADVLITCNNGFYLLDPTNFLIYKLLNNNKGKDNLNNRIELRVNLNSNINANIDRRKKILSKIDEFNDWFSSMECCRVDNNGLSTFLDYGVRSCQKHMDDILEYRKKYDSLYRKLALDISDVYITLSNEKKKLLKRG